MVGDTNRENRVKKLIAFDLDGTLAPSKSLLDPTMADILNRLLEHFEVLIISGGKYELFQRQVLTQITKEPKLLKKLHLMPTSGTRYYTYDEVSGEWNQNYAEDFSPEQKEKIITALKEGFEKSGFKPERSYGEFIEDRDSQITLSVLGQEIVAELGEEGLKMKEEWDPDNKKKLAICKIVQPMIPEFEVRAAGVTSIDVTKPGIDKAYGMQKLMEHTGIAMDDILFFGDKVIEGGNDLPVQQMGVDTIAIHNWQNTAQVLNGILHVL
jgi:HAD superfamily hydrolase (TIGR01484 family)